MKERLGMTEMHKQANRMTFGEIEQDAYQVHQQFLFSNILFSLRGFFPVNNRTRISGRHRLQRGSAGKEGFGPHQAGTSGQQDQGEDQQVDAAEAEQGQQPRPRRNVHHFLQIWREIDHFVQARRQVDHQGRQIGFRLHCGVHSAERSIKQVSSIKYI